MISGSRWFFFLLKISLILIGVYPFKSLHSRTWSPIKFQHHQANHCTYLAATQTPFTHEKNFFRRRRPRNHSPNTPIVDSLTAEQNLPLNFRSGFVTIIGNPNVGKSTLLNAILGENLTIISPKPQTTRHRVFGIYNDDGSQIVFSDTPGLLEPAYPLQKIMLETAKAGTKDADIVLMVTDIVGAPLINIKLDENFTATPMIIAINKFDVLQDRNDSDSKQEILYKTWSSRFPQAEIVFISALHNFGVLSLVDRIKSRLPCGPRYYAKDQLSTHSERFHSSEFIRESIFEIYKEEIPYCCHVRIDRFKDVTETLSSIDATICVSRKSQKMVVEGHNRWTLNKLTSSARTKLEKFLQRKVALTLKVEVDEDWRKKHDSLNQYGYCMK